MTDLTPQEIQEARTIARNVIGRDFQRSLRVHVLARAVLALTEQQPAQESPTLPAGWKPIADAPHDGTAIEGYYGPDETLAVRWAEERSCMLAGTAPGAGLFGPGWEDVANGLYVDDPIGWRLTEQQPEPVSCDELADAISDGIGLEFGDRGEFAYDAAVHLLSRYTITRKPEGADHG